FISLIYSQLSRKKITKKYYTQANTTLGQLIQLCRKLIALLLGYVPVFVNTFLQIQYISYKEKLKVLSHTLIKKYNKMNQYKTMNYETLQYSRLQYFDQK